MGTPSLNDLNSERNDESTIIELMKKHGAKLNDMHQSLSFLILCMMPNASQCISKLIIKAVNKMLHIFSSFDERVDIPLHPKYCIIFNDVSRYGDNYDPHLIKNDPTYDPLKQNSGMSKYQRIDDIKSRLQDKAKRSYLHDKLSNETRNGKKSWKDIKDSVCNGDYKNESWYSELLEHQQRLVEDLKTIQQKIGLNQPMEPQGNIVRA